MPFGIIAQVWLCSISDSLFNSWKLCQSLQNLCIIKLSAQSYNNFKSTSQVCEVVSKWHHYTWCTHALLVVYDKCVSLFLPATLIITKWTQGHAHAYSSIHSTANLAKRLCALSCKQSHSHAIWTLIPCIHEWYNHIWLHLMQLAAIYSCYWE